VADPQKPQAAVDLALAQRRAWGLACCRSCYSITNRKSAMENRARHISKSQELHVLTKR